VRSYTDSGGVTWVVYVVHPVGETSKRLLRPEYEQGWLCFESDDGGKRRLAPIPSDWESCNEARLESYRTAAGDSPPRQMPTSDGRNAPEGGLAADLREIEHFFTRRLPASLSLALDRFAERLDQPEAPTALKSAVPMLRLAARTASVGDFDAAREQYRAAAASFPAALTGLSSTS
jgi:hypothetical protein